MFSKRRFVTLAINFTDGWNREIHSAIENKVMANCKETFPAGDVEVAQVEMMRKFYYSRMAITANLLAASTAALVSIVALIVSVVALVR